MRKTGRVLLSGIICLFAATVAWAGGKDKGADAQRDNQMTETEALTEGGSGMLQDLTGGWSITEKTTVTDDAQAVFDEATKSLLGVQYEPVALLATQVVSGTNYCFLARAEVVAPDASPSYKLVYVWQPLGKDESAQVLDIQDLDLGVSVEEE